MHNLPELTCDETARSLIQLGAEVISFRAGQVLQYEGQIPRGHFLPMAGSLLLTHEAPAARASDPAGASATRPGQGSEGVPSGQSPLTARSLPQEELLERFDALTRVRLFPALGELEKPLPFTLQADTDVVIWFFSRSICQPRSFRLLFLDGLHMPGNPLFKLWSLHVASRSDR